MQISVYSYPNVAARDKKTKANGDLVGTADTPLRLIELVNATGKRPVGYFRGDQAEKSLETALVALGAEYNEHLDRYYWAGEPVPGI